MRNRSRFYRFLLCGAIALGLLSGCGGGTDSGDGLDPKSSPGSPEPTVNAALKPRDALSTEYKIAAENGEALLYVQESSLSIRVKDKKTGYVWHSAVEGLVEGEDNDTWKNFMLSGISLTYFTKDVATPNQTDLLSEKNVSVGYAPEPEGFGARIKLDDLQIALDLHVRLEGRQLVVSIPNQSIEESGNFKLAALYAYPFLGSTRKGDIPGYMFIPDGAGALIPLKDNQGKFKQPYEAKIYGSNAGIEAYEGTVFVNAPYQVYFPVFGIVHREGGSGLFGVVENGQFNANVVAYPNGVGSAYNWISAQYVYRQAYLQPTSRTLGGIQAFEKFRNPDDVRTRYFMLRDEEAGYAGMARTYREYLTERGVLKPSAAGRPDADIPIRLDAIGAETENGLFRNRLVKLTTVAQLENMLEDMKRSGVRNQVVVLKGWTAGGLSGTAPAPLRWESALGSKAEFRALADRLRAEGAPLYAYADYTAAYAGSSRFNPASDAAKKVDKTVASWKTFGEVYKEMYLLSAAKAEEIAGADAEKLPGLGVSGLAVNGIGGTLFSEWDGKRVRPRSENGAAYERVAGTLSAAADSLALYAPNAYLMGAADRLFDMPMSSSRYVFTGETVPFLQMVLKGSKSLFAPYANFFANTATDRLRMIEYGMYPSYVLTAEATHKLKHTNSSELYTTAYADWKEELARTYRMANEALRPVEGARMEERSTVLPGIVKVRYSNGKAIVVNYTAQDEKVDGQVVPAKGFAVMEVKPR